MKLVTFTFVFLTSFVLTGCVTQQPRALEVSDQEPAFDKQSSSEVKEGVDTSGWKVYENEELGVRFRIPEMLELKSQAGELPSFDIGKRTTFTFYNSDLEYQLVVSFFSHDYSQGVVEGLPNYFRFSVNDAKHAREFFEGYLTDLEIEELEVEKKQGFYVTGNGGYNGGQSNIIYVFPNMIDSKSISNAMFHFSGKELFKKFSSKKVIQGLISTLEVK